MLTMDKTIHDLIIPTRRWEIVRTDKGQFLLRKRGTKIPFSRGQDGKAVFTTSEGLEYPFEPRVRTAMDNWVNCHYRVRNNRHQVLTVVKVAPRKYRLGWTHPDFGQGLSPTEWAHARIFPTVAEARRNVSCGCTAPLYITHLKKYVF